MLGVFQWMIGLEKTDQNGERTSKNNEKLPYLHRSVAKQDDGIRAEVGLAWQPCSTADVFSFSGCLSFRDEICKFLKFVLSTF